MYGTNTWKLGRSFILEKITTRILILSAADAVCVSRIVFKTAQKYPSVTKGLVAEAVGATQKLQ